MLKIGEFSKLSMLTIKALRFYEKEELLIPARVDEHSGYRFYEASQLEIAAKIKALRQLDFTVEEIKAHYCSLRDKQKGGRGINPSRYIFVKVNPK